MATVWKRKDRDMWAVDYRDVTGKRIRLAAATRQDAEALLAEKIKESREMHPLAADLRDMTLKDYVARWSERVRGEIEEKTWRACWELTVNERPVADVAKELEMTANACFLAKSRVLRRLRVLLDGLWE